MIIFWIGFAITLICILWSLSYSRWYGEFSFSNFCDDLGINIFLTFMLCLLYTLIAGLIMCALVYGFQNPLPKKYEYSWSNEIISMQDNNAYIISRGGYAESSDRYYYMVKQDGYFKTYWSPQDYSKIIEVDDGKYEVKTFTEVADPHNWLQRDLARFYNLGIGTKNHEWEFYVPKGSVVQDFKIDSK